MLFNTCRETGDHGPFNSWDRQVYITELVPGGVGKLYDTITRNFMIADYSASDSVDNDDGSNRYGASGSCLHSSHTSRVPTLCSRAETYSNVLYLGENGMKANTAGYLNQCVFFCSIVALLCFSPCAYLSLFPQLPWKPARVHPNRLGVLELVADA